MSNYALYPYKQGGKCLHPKNEWITAEYMPERFKIYMTDKVIEDGYKLFRRYRLRTAEPTRFTDTLEYDIECPYCRDKLRFCGMPVDAYTHGLYKCRRCDETEERRR